jgi:hypothetical protein
MSGVGRFFGNLFGTEKALEAVVKTSTEMLDDAFYTDQEKADDRAIARTEARGMIVNWVAATTGSRLARRGLAFSITAVWLFQHMLSTSMVLFATYADSEGVVTAEKLTASATILDNRSVEMQGAVMLILGFYFAAPFMGDIAKGALTQFSGRNK